MNDTRKSMRISTVGEHEGSNRMERTYVTPALERNLCLTASASTYYYLTEASGGVEQ